MGYPRGKDMENILIRGSEYKIFDLWKDPSKVSDLAQLACQILVIHGSVI